MGNAPGWFRRIWLAGNFVQLLRKHFGLPLELQTVGMEKDRLARRWKRFYRIVKEALNNVPKHAQATSVAIVLERRSEPSDCVSMIIEDKGVGLTGTEYPAGSIKDWGWWKGANVPALLGGTIEIESHYYNACRCNPCLHNAFQGLSFGATCSRRTTPSYHLLGCPFIYRVASGQTHRRSFAHRSSGDSMFL